jgi:hypothetical protein
VELGEEAYRSPKPTASDNGAFTKKSLQAYAHLLARHHGSSDVAPEKTETEVINEDWALKGCREAIDIRTRLSKRGS